MATLVTNKIIKLIESAEDKKRDLEDRIKNAEKTKDKHKSKFRAAEFATAAIIKDPAADSAVHLKMIASESSKMMDEDQHITELKRDLADITNKIGEIKHWTTQSEYGDDKKQAEALSYATKAFQSI